MVSRKRRLPRTKKATGFGLEFISLILFLFQEGHILKKRTEHLHRLQPLGVFRKDIILAASNKLMLRSIGKQIQLKEKSVGMQNVIKYKYIQRTISEVKNVTSEKIPARPIETKSTTKTHKRRKETIQKAGRNGKRGTLNLW